MDRSMRWQMTAAPGTGVIRSGTARPPGSGYTLLPSTIQPKFPTAFPSSSRPIFDRFDLSRHDPWHKAIVSAFSTLCAELERRLERGEILKDEEIVALRRLRHFADAEGTIKRLRERNFDNQDRMEGELFAGDGLGLAAIACLPSSAR